MMCIRLLQGAAGYIIPLLSFIQYCVTYAFILVRIMHFGHIYWLLTQMAEHLKTYLSTFGLPSLKGSLGLIDRGMLQRKM